MAYTQKRNGKTKNKGSLKKFIKSVVKNPLIIPKTFVQSVKKVGTDVYKKVKAKKGTY